MKANRNTKWFTVASGLIVVLVTTLAFYSSGSAYRNPNFGVGEVRRFEAQQANQEVAKPFSDHPYTGMGDLRYFESLQEGQNVAKPDSPRPATGIGELRRFEYLQSLQDPAQPSNPLLPSGTVDLRMLEPGRWRTATTELFDDHPYLGMGDLRYFEYLQEKVIPSVNPAASP